MKQEPSIAYSAARAPKAAAIAGIIFSVLLIISLVIILISVPANSGNSASWLSTKGNSLLLAIHLVPFSGIAFLWFMGVVRDRLGTYEDRFIATVFLGSGLLFLATLFVLSALTGGIIYLYNTQTSFSLASDYYNFGRAIAQEILNTYMLKMAGVFMISTSTLFLRSRVIPRWMALLGYGLAAIMLLRISHTDRLVWISLAFPLWVLLISVCFLVDSYRRKSEGTSPGQGATH